MIKEEGAWTPAITTPIDRGYVELEQTFNAPNIAENKVEGYFEDWTLISSSRGMVRVVIFLLNETLLTMAQNPSTSDAESVCFY